MVKVERTSHDYTLHIILHLLSSLIMMIFNFFFYIMIVYMIRVYLKFNIIPMDSKLFTVKHRFAIFFYFVTV